jgi:hypothetical protein
MANYSDSVVSDKGSDGQSVELDPFFVVVSPVVHEVYEISHDVIFQRLENETSNFLGGNYCLQNYAWSYLVRP